MQWIKPALHLCHHHQLLTQTQPQFTYGWLSNKKNDYWIEYSNHQREQQCWYSDESLAAIHHIVKKESNKKDNNSDGNHSGHVIDAPTKKQKFLKKVHEQFIHFVVIEMNHSQPYIILSKKRATKKTTTATVTDCYKTFIWMSWGKLLCQSQNT